MGYTTFQQARAFVESGYGDCSKAKLSTAVNKIRQHFYSWYQELALFLDATECFRVQTFCMDCHECQDTYRGVTLPRDFLNVEAMWFNSHPMRLQSDWREFQVGMSPECDCRLEKFDMPGSYSTALDIHPRTPVRLVVRAFSLADQGKRFRIEGVDSAGRKITSELALSPEPQRTPEWFREINRAGGIIKPHTEGQVVLADEHGRMLSLYDPEDIVPTYKRIKISGLPNDCAHVNIRAARRYFPLYGDNDLAETDNSVVWDSMARYLRLYEKGGKDRNDLATEKDHYATAFKMMMGDKARDRGKGTQASVTIQSPRFGGTRLNRIGGLRW